MKLVKLKCGTWINAEAVKRIQALDPPIEEEDGTILRARVGFLGEYDPWDTEETVEELVEIILNAVGNPSTILISGHASTSPGDVPPGPPDPPRPAGRTEVG